MERHLCAGLIEQKHALVSLSDPKLLLFFVSYQQLNDGFIFVTLENITGAMSGMGDTSITWVRDSILKS
jgi:hypothetical protein